MGTEKTQIVAGSKNPVSKKFKKPPVSRHSGTVPQQVRNKSLSTLVSRLHTITTIFFCPGCGPFQAWPLLRGCGTYSLRCFFPGLISRQANWPLAAVSSYYRHSPLLPCSFCLQVAVLPLVLGGAAEGTLARTWRRRSR